MHRIASTARLALLVAITASGCKSPPPQIAAATSATPPPASVRTIRSQALPEMNGKRLDLKLIEVSYPPSGASRAHTHPCAVFGYVLEGALRSQVRGDSAAIYRAGETFYEPPNGVHAVSANASTTAPVRFLATFVCDSDAPLSTPVPQE